MEMFYTPEDVEDEYAVKAKVLANWRANLIGPHCIKRKDKILYHSAEIDEWFETQNPEPEPEEKPKPESESKPEPEKKSAPDTEPEIKTKTDSNTRLQPDTKSEYLTPKEVSELFNTSEKTLANWRSQGRGPTYFKLGNKIRYATEKTKEWFGDKETESESEEDIKTEPPDGTETIIRIIQPPKPKYLSEYLTPREVGEKFKLKEQTLANWRSQDKGPKFHKFGNRVYYSIDLLDKWVASSRIRIYGNDD